MMLSYISMQSGRYHYVPVYIDATTLWRDAGGSELAVPSVVDGNATNTHPTQAKFHGASYQWLQTWHSQSSANRVTIFAQNFSRTHPVSLTISDASGVLVQEADVISNWITGQGVQGYEVTLPRLSVGTLHTNLGALAQGGNVRLHFAEIQVDRI